jgi:hypothetical protein
VGSSLAVKTVTCRSWLFIKQVGYFFAPSGKPYPDNWIVTDVIYEFERSLLSRSGHSVSGKPNNSSGDGTVCITKYFFPPKLNLFWLNK